jgi:hypothetical protein
MDVMHRIAAVKSSTVLLLRLRMARYRLRRQSCASGPRQLQLICSSALGLYWNPPEQLN